jgi:VCBS repeat protein
MARMGTRARLAGFAAAALWSVMASTASAAVITFEDIVAPGHDTTGVVVNTRYQSQGVTFNDPRAFDYSKGSAPIAGFAHSGTVAVEQCAGVEFCTAPVRADFSTAQRLVRVWVGFSYPLNEPLGVRMTAYNEAGTAVGTAQATLPASTKPTPIDTPLAVELAPAAIRRIDVTTTTNGGYTAGLAVDDVEFSSAGPPPPCGASAAPAISLTQPADGLTVQGDAFPLAGTVDGKGSAISDASVIVRSGGAERGASVYPSLIGSGGGPFGPTLFSGVLQLGANDVTAYAVNCRGSGTSNTRRVYRAVPRPGPRPPACQIQPDHPAVHVLAGATNEEREADLLGTLRSDFKGQIVVPFAARIDLTGDRDIPVDPGVQIVGERDALGRRPLIYSDTFEDYTLFSIPGPDVCLEGLRLRGPSPTTAKNKPEPIAVQISQNPRAYQVANVQPVVIADMEIESWPEAAVEIKGTVPIECDDGDDTTTDDCDRPGARWGPKREAADSYTGPRMNPDDAPKVQVANNYIHHNARSGGGYGVSIHNSAYATITGNVFEYNRHSITSSGYSFSGYTARFNYMQEGGFQYPAPNGYWGPHLDVHGTENFKEHSWAGGIAGEYHLVADNTIRGEQQYNCEGIPRCRTRMALTLRGRPTEGLFFKRNVVVMTRKESIDRDPGEDPDLQDVTDAAFNIHRDGNKYDTDYSSRLETGDFDGDQRTDVFLSNGTGWFFSRAGIRPWEFLRPSPVLEQDLGFADIDGDRATDVLKRAADGTISYYRNGFSDPQPLTTPPITAPVPMSQIRFGDFDGNGRTDLFYTKDKQWNVLYAGSRQWTKTQTSNARVEQLLLGEFDDVRGTDLAAVRNGGFSYSSASTGSWTRMNGKLRPTLEGAVAADFDGNGRTDIAWDDGGTWRYSPDGNKPLKRLRRKEGSVGSLQKLLIGHFDPDPKAQVIAFGPSNRLRFGIWRGIAGENYFVRRSEQNMR